MSLIEIIVPTTRAPAHILGLGRESARIGRSTICLNGTAKQAGVDADYNAFVREPTGVIEKLLNHNAFRADVSSPIDAGSSWQLGFFLAHLLAAEERLFQALTQESSLARQTVWATGTVNSVGLRVSQIGHLERKARQILESKQSGLFVYPQENAEDMPQDLAHKLREQGVELHTVKSAPEAMELLGINLSTVADASSATSPQKWADDAWRGLEVYNRQHRPIFFGRAKAREEAVEQLRRNAARGTAILIIHGRSGAGKSSLLRAGLLDDITENAGEGEPWERALVRFGGADQDCSLWTRLIEQLRSDDPDFVPPRTSDADPLPKRVTQLLDTLECNHLLLGLDQLEQLFLENKDRQASVGKEIADLCRTGKVWIVATVRTDRLTLLENTPQLERIAQGPMLYHLAAPSLSELAQIIRGPAALAGLSFAETPEGGDLGDTLADIAHGAPDSLPLLQVALTRLSKMAAADGVLSLTNYERVGGFSGAVEYWANETLSALKGEGFTDKVIDSALISLVQLDANDGRTDARSVDPTQSSPNQQSILASLVEARLATRGENGNVWLTHETLLREWPYMVTLVQDQRANLTLRDRIETSAQLWASEDYAQTELLKSEARVVAAESLRSSEVVQLSSQAQDFVSKSREDLDLQSAAEMHREQTRLKRARQVAVLASAAAIGLAVLGATAWVQRGKAQDFASEALAQQDIAKEETLKAQRSAALMTASTSRQLVDEGETDKALLTLLNAARSFTNNNVPNSILAAFDYALVRGGGEVTHWIPSEAQAFALDHALYYILPSEKALYRIEADGTSRRLSSAHGEFFRAYNLLKPLGTVIALQSPNQMKFHSFDPERGVGQELLVLPYSPSGEDSFPLIEMGHDGAFLAWLDVTEPWPGEEASFAFRKPAVIGSLEKGEYFSLSFEDSIQLELISKEDGESQVLVYDWNGSSRIQKTIEELGVQAATTTSPRDDLKSSARRCVGPNATGRFAENFVAVLERSAEHFTFSGVGSGASEVGVGQSVCATDGPYLWVLDDVTDATGKSNELYFSNSFNDFGDSIYPVSTGLKWVSGVDLFAEYQRYRTSKYDPEWSYSLIWFGLRQLYLQQGEGVKEKRVMSTPIDAAGFLDKRHVAVVLEAEQPNDTRKRLVVLDLQNLQTFGSEILNGSLLDPVADEARWLVTQSIIDPQSARGQFLAPSERTLRPTDDKETLQRRIGYLRVTDFPTPEGLRKNIILIDSGPKITRIQFEGDERPIAVPTSWAEDWTNIQLSSNNQWYVAWVKGELFVRDSLTADIIFKFSMPERPNHFSFAFPNQSDILVTEQNTIRLVSLSSANEIVHKVLFRSNDPLNYSALSPQGDRLVVGFFNYEGDKPPKIIDVSSSVVWRSLSGNLITHSFPVFLDNNRILYFSGKNWEIQTLFDLNTATAKAYEALSPSCLFDGDDPAVSECW